MKGNIKKKT